jgi:hypothetical protein
MIELGLAGSLDDMDGDQLGGLMSDIDAFIGVLGLDCLSVLTRSR